ncbi:SKP1-like protein 21 isoform X2 [Arachis ipaensis]|uniref:SKP1-like protein 21 isoform X2 n=1 Tax=Arachis ipaensis TaxID=130454 RepID=UPI000A2B5D88|nr:SKP1-like protein 21 isoform X2 [Arachis ipaensis]XP_029148553.1 SKP1-like protein 21 isoform X3 [Arachis hypogaea]
MSEAAMAVMKPEMKSYIWLKTVDGSIQQVEQDVAMFCPMIFQEILKTGMGSSKTYAISLPQRVNPSILGLILDYCRFHQVPGHSNKERKTFDEKFIRMDTKKLCELTSAADSLQLKPLVDLTSRALARIIEGKTPEEIRETFHLPDDLTEEEKLEPLRNVTDDPRIRLLNRLYARKRKELKEKKKLKELDSVPFACHNRNVDNALKASPSKHSQTQDLPPMSFSPKLEFINGDLDDELDPAMKEELDREVEDFARRLNSDWPERMQILSLGQDRRLVPISMNSNVSTRIFTGMG